MRSATSRFASLLARLHRATAVRGKKAALAAFLDVPPQRVAEWLRGVHEPGAEVTLKLLEWVTAEEAKQKGPGSALTPPERKTQSRRSTHENRKPGPPKV